MKKILSLIIAMAFLLSFAFSVYAENGIDGENQKSITISYTVAGNYEISIPSSYNGSGSGKKGISVRKEISLLPEAGDTVASFVLEVNDVLLEQDTMLRISVKSENQFFLMLPNGTSVPYILTGADEEGTVMVLHAGETHQEKELTITLGDTTGLNYAGMYYDKLTFDCEILRES